MTIYRALAATAALLAVLGRMHVHATVAGAPLDIPAGAFVVAAIAAAAVFVAWRAVRAAMEHKLRLMWVTA